MIGDRYERILKLGEGTYGKVYKARDTLSGDIVALKKCRIQVCSAHGSGGERTAKGTPAAGTFRFCPLRKGTIYVPRFFMYRWIKKVSLQPPFAKCHC